MSFNKCQIFWKKDKKPFFVFIHLFESESLKSQKSHRETETPNGRFNAQLSHFGGEKNVS